MRPPTSGWDAFRELDDFRERMARLLEAFGGSSPDAPGGAGWSPLVDIEETDDAYVFELDLPGVRREDVEVEVDGNELRVSGEVSERERTGILRHRARRTGRFEYRSTLPQEVDPERIEAGLGDGVLTVRVPKSRRSQARRIEIRGA
jgi:HSP20 family protein